MEQRLFDKAQTTGAMWDTWLYWREGTYYLYHLAGHIDEPYHYGIAMATSNDGVHWREHGLVLEKAEDVAWRARARPGRRRHPAPHQGSS